MSNINQQVEQYYENVEINITSGGGAQQLSTLGTTFKSKLNTTSNSTENATAVMIRTSQTITSADSPYEISGIKIIDMWITNNSGSTAAVRLFFQPTKY